jgi:diaminopimelate decarboxylase
MENAYFHGNNKTDADIAFAMEHGVGYFVADGMDELEAVDRIAGESGICQKLLLRLTPGIDPHTYAAVNTGMVDSKFGTAIETGQAMELIKAALKMKNVSVEGFHCHVGSQVFGEDVYQRTSLIMLRFFARLKKELGYETKQFDIGGGYGVRYVDSDADIDIAACIDEVADYMKRTAAELGIALPKILMEPGRSIAADAGMTLYTAGTVKRIPGYKNYVSVDGGMTDNPRYALYGSRYTVYSAARMERKGRLSPATWWAAAARAATSSSLACSCRSRAAATSSPCAPRAPTIIPWRPITTACRARRWSCWTGSGTMRPSAGRRSRTSL